MKLFSNVYIARKITLNLEREVMNWNKLLRWYIFNGFFYRRNNRQVDVLNKKIMPKFIKTCFLASNLDFTAFNKHISLYEPKLYL